MLSDASERRRVEICRDANGGLKHTFNFDVTEPLPWRAEVDMAMCSDCFLGSDEERDMSPAESAALAAEIEKIQGELQKSNAAWVFDRIAAGEAIMTEEGVLAIAPFGHSHLNKLRKEGRFPQPVISAGKNIWLASEARLALAKIAAGDTERAAARQRPLNRHERRKLAARK